MSGQNPKPDAPVAVAVAQPIGTPVEPTPHIKDQDRNFSSYLSEHPNSMNPYERKPKLQFMVVGASWVVGFLNCWYNFRMIRLWEELLDELRALPEIDTLSVSQLGDLANQALASTENGDCDGLFFLNDFETRELEDPIQTILRITKASAYLSAYFFVPLYLIIKALTARNLVTETFDVADHHDMIAERSKQNLEERDPNKASPKKLKWNLVRTAAINESLVLESEGEKRVRIFLRCETLLFGFVQFFQDIPQFTCAVLYIFFILSQRSVSCFASMVNDGEVGKVENADDLDPLVFGQVSVIVFSIFVNMAPLAVRWATFFNHRTDKLKKKQVSTTARGCQAVVWVFGYLLAVILPFLAVLYSDLAEDLFGLPTSGQVVIFIFMMIGAFLSLVGMFLICCVWGVEFGTSVCVGCVICEAVALGCEEVEICEIACETCCGC